MIESLWANIEMPGPFPELRQDLKTDVLIIGGGMAGLLCAYLLEQAGVDYTLIEADRICCGITRNTTAKLTSQHGLIYDRLIREFDADTARLYWEANEKALAEYRRLSQSIDCGFETKSHAVYTVDRPAKLEKEWMALEKIGVETEYTETLPLPFPIAGAIRFPNQAQFHPLQFAAALAKGLHIYEHTKALAFTGHQVNTEHARITASKIIVATHFPIFNKHGGYFLKLYQERSYVLALEGAEEVDGMYLDAAESGLSFRSYGNTLLIGGGTHRTGKPGTGWSGLQAFAAAQYPAAHEVCRWAAQDCMTLDGVPYIGRYSRGTPDLYTATGFQKWGMTSSMVAAMILCDLVQEKENPYAAVFSPSRAVFRRQFFVNAAESTVNLLTLTKPRCPHLGCALKWNPQEHSWDCPCHGSRFSEDGAVLDLPAAGNLKHIP